MTTLSAPLPSLSPPAPPSLHVGLQLARAVYVAVGVVLVPVAILGLDRSEFGLAGVVFFALLIAYPLGLARAVPRLRPRWRGDRLSWWHALPLLLHALVGLWGALGVVAMALQGAWGEGLEAILVPGLAPAAVGLAFGWLIGLALATCIDGMALFVRIAFFVPLGLLVLAEIAADTIGAAG